MKADGSTSPQPGGSGTDLPGSPLGLATPLVGTGHEPDMESQRPTLLHAKTVRPRPRDQRLLAQPSDHLLANPLATGLPQQEEAAVRGGRQRGRSATRPKTRNATVIRPHLTGVCLW